MTLATPDFAYKLASALPWVAVSGAAVMAFLHLVRGSGTARQRQATLEVLLCLWACFAWLMTLQTPQIVVVRTGWQDPRWVGLGWAAGSVVCVIWVLTRAAGADRGRRQEKLPDGSTVWVSESGLASAWVVGQRTVVTQGFLDSFGHADRHHVLRHEAAHAASLHWWRGVGCALVASLLWWHPAAWLVAREISLQREIEADEAGALGDRLGYASALLLLAECGKSRGYVAQAGGACDRRWAALRSSSASRWSPGQALSTLCAAASLVPLVGASGQPGTFGDGPRLVKVTMSSQGTGHKATIENGRYLLVLDDVRQED